MKLYQLILESSPEHPLTVLSASQPTRGMWLRLLTAASGYGANTASYRAAIEQMAEVPFQKIYCAGVLIATVQEIPIHARNYK